MHNLHPAMHEVSLAAVLVVLEEEHAAHICVAGPVHAQEADRKACVEVVHEVQNGMRVRHGEGAAWGVAHDREGQDACREAFKQWLTECKVI